LAFFQTVISHFKTCFITLALKPTD